MMSEKSDDSSCKSGGEQLTLYEILSYCSSAAISDKGLREIFERHENLVSYLRDSHYLQFFFVAFSNEKVTEEIIQCLLEYFPAAANYGAANNGQMLLHHACGNNNVSADIIQVLIDANPDAVRHEDSNGDLPLHYLCNNEESDESSAMAILKLLLEKYPDSVRHKSNSGCLPIHTAALSSKSPEFCSMLIEAYPGSERSAVNTGMLPLHYACFRSSFATVQYLYNLYPDAIDHAIDGVYPIHAAIGSVAPHRVDNPEDALDIVKFLLKGDPRVKFQEYTGGESLLHFACRCDYGRSSTIVALGMIEAIYDAHPELVRKEDDDGHLPLHQLFVRPSQDETTRIAILKLLLEKCPELIRHTDNNGCLPIHIAAPTTTSLEIFNLMFEAYPGSERIAVVSTGMMPFHYASMHNTVAIVEYLHNMYPDSINHATPGGFYPIHLAIRSIITRETNREAAVDIVKFLLDCDPRVKFQKVRGTVYTLVLACFLDYNNRNIRAGMDIIKAIFDAHPEIIGRVSWRDDIVLHPLLQDFVDRQLAYYRQANDTRLMTTPDDNGQLPLHTELQNNARPGSIKLLVKGNRLAVRYPDNNGALPLHVACMHHKSASVVQYLIELDTATLDAVDYEGNTVLHYACNGSKYETISLLLDKYDAVSVSKRNAEGKLPIEILWEKEDGVFRSFTLRIKYTEIVFLLLRAYPEMMNYSA